MARAGFPLFGICLEGLVAAECCYLCAASREDAEDRRRFDEDQREHDIRLAKTELRLEAEQRENARLREERLLRAPPGQQAIYGMRLRL